MRDAILGVPIGDFDVATDATPDQIEELFDKTIPVGKQFGIIMIPFAWGSLEIASFRSDGSYGDGRRPDSVTLSNPQEDAKRRDFTVNALFYDLKTEQVIDFVEGQKDIQNRILKTVGNPEERFSEDHLRILRALRFVGQLDFALEKKTLEAVIHLKDKITTVSRERIREELTKTWKGQKREKSLKLMIENQIFDLLFPDLSWPSDFESKAKKIFSSFPEVDSFLNWLGFLTPLFLITELSAIQKTLQSLKFPSKEEKIFLLAYDVLKNPQKVQNLSWGEQCQILSEKRIREAFHFALVIAPEDFAFYTGLERKIKKQFGDDVQLPEPFVSGADLIQLGHKTGPKMGDLLKKLYEEQLSGKFTSKKQALESLS